MIKKQKCEKSGSLCILTWDHLRGMALKEFWIKYPSSQKSWFAPKLWSFSNPNTVVLLCKPTWIVLVVMPNYMVNENKSKPRKNELKSKSNPKDSVFFHACVVVQMTWLWYDMTFESEAPSASVMKTFSLFNAWIKHCCVWTHRQNVKNVAGNMSNRLREPVFQSKIRSAVLRPWLRYVIILK